jgi:RHS repeat-associated protein
MGRLVGTTTQYAFVTGTFRNSYTYDANSNRLTLTDPQSGVTNYAYDTLNRLSTLTPPTVFSSTGFGFTYDVLNRRTQMTRPNGVATNYSYDNLSRLLSVLHQVGTSTIDGAAYTYDSAGNPLTKTNELSAVTSNYTYDPLNELTLVTQATNTTESYSFDPVGNRLTSLGVSPYSNNTSNELTSTPTASYSYDYNGNLTSKTVSGSTTQYTWDFENRLTSVVLPGAEGTVTFKYDGLGHKVQKAFAQNSTTTTTNYLYDGANAIEDVDQNGNVLARYEQTGNIDEPLAELRSGTTSYYQADGLGSVTSLSSSTGALANTYTYDSFGNVTASTGSLTNRFEYTGREFDSEIGIYYYRARYYDPNAGRFTSEDPTRFGIKSRPAIRTVSPDFYSYVANNPLKGIDPTGLWEVEIGGGHGAGVLVRFGYSPSSGQFNFGFFGGVGEGAFFNYDPTDPGCHKPGLVGGITGEGDVGLGKHLGASGELDLNGESSATATIVGPGFTGLQFNLLNLKEPPHGTIGGGAGGSWGSEELLSSAAVAAIGNQRAGQNGYDTFNKHDLRASATKGRMPLVLSVLPTGPDSRHLFPRISPAWRLSHQPWRQPIRLSRGCISIRSGILRTSAEVSDHMETGLGFYRRVFF